MKKSVLFVFIIITFFSCKNEKKDNTTSTETQQVSIPETITKLIEVAKKDSTNTDLQLQIVTSLDSIGLHKEALLKVDRLITHDSLNNTLWLKRGQICKQLEDTAAAIKAFKYAARVYPTPPALMELANLYAETKNPLTISVCNQLVKMNPGGNYNAQANFFAGIYFSKIGDNKNAIAAFDQSIGENIHFTEAYIEKGYIFYNAKKYPEALRVFEQLTKVNQTSADGFYWQAKCNEAMNNAAQAVSLYNKALEFDPNIKEASAAIERLKK